MAEKNGSELKDLLTKAIKVMFIVIVLLGITLLLLGIALILLGMTFYY